MRISAGRLLVGALFLTTSLAGVSAVAAEPEVVAATGSKDFVVDPAPAPIKHPRRVAHASYVLANTFELHSKPGSRRTLFIDFDGAVVSNTLWNGPDGNNLPGAQHPAWDPDGNGPAFTAAEQAMIQDIWKRVAEDYAPFDVDVTTQFPGEAAIDRAGGTDQVYGTRALVSPSDAAVDHICGGACGGVAYIDVFDDASSHAGFQPAWIFPQNLSDDVKAVAEAISHEVGHNFGLDHDGDLESPDYYEGHGFWAPLMGSSYGEPITQWSNGSYAGATNTQDDIATIAASGAPYRADEDGGSIGTAALLVPTLAPAYISKRTDVDYYSIGACAGTVTVTGAVAAVSPNLDLQLQLLSSQGTVIASANPVSAQVSRDVASGLGATVSASVPAGTYVVAVDGVGNGSPVTGYDDYGSLGAYTLSVSGCTSAVLDLASAPTGVSATPAGPSSITLSWGEPERDGGSAIIGYVVKRSGSEPSSVGAGLRSQLFTGLSAGTDYTFEVAAINGAGISDFASIVARIPAAVRPGAPRIGKASSGTPGGASTATVRWQPPTGAAVVTGYQVYAYRLNARGAVVRSLATGVLGVGLRAASLSLPKGTYRLAVRASSAIGYGSFSARSAKVTAR